MRAALALAIALAGCGAGARPPLSGNATTTGASAPTTAAPRIGWRRIADGAGAFEIDQLPRVARSGRIAVAALVEGDGGRGFPNLRLEVRDREDRVVETIGVMESSEFEALVPDGETPGAELVRRIDAANRRLVVLHGQYELVAMREIDAGDPSSRNTPLRGDGLVVTWPDDHRLRVRTRDGAELAVIDGSSWLAPTSKRCPQCPPCTNEARLRAFYKAAHITTIVVRITYSGTDLCWEPGDQLHVVAW